MTKLNYIKSIQIPKTIKNVTLKSYTSGCTDTISRRHINVLSKYIQIYIFI